MVGLNAVMNPGAQPKGGDPQPAAPEDDGNVTPEEQAMYDMFVTNGLKAIYPEGEGDPVNPKVLASLKSTENPMMSLAVTAVMLTTALRDSAKQAGQPIPEDVLFHGGLALVEELAEVSEAAKIHDFTEEEIEQSFYAALDMYRTQATQSGDLDAEQLKAGWNEIVTADKEGRIGQVLPGIEERINAAPKEQMQ